MKKLHLAFLVILSLCFVLLLTACSSSAGTVVSAGSTGPQGPAGPQGERGPQGLPGKDGAPGKDAVSPVGTGLKVEITKVDFIADGRPVVTLTMTDGNSQAVAVKSLEGYGFTIAQVYEDKASELTSFESLLVHDVEGKPYQWKGETKQPALPKATQAYADTDGAWGDQGNGVYTYTFKNPLTKQVDKALMTAVGIYAWKNNRQSVANNVYYFVPAGTFPVAERKVVTTAACETCHNPLQAHGGLRRDIGLCNTCHTDQTVDPETGNTLNLKVMVHKLHFGSQLPSVQSGNPYIVVGYRQTVADFSRDAWPQDTRYCITCHSGGAQSANFKNRPNIAACTSCHDATNVSTGDNHPGGKQADGSCSACHPADGSEFDASVSGAHTIPIASHQIKEFKMEILGVEGAKAGGAPLVKFKLTESDGTAVDAAKMDYLAVTLAGPTSDYTNRWTETIASKDATTPSAVVRNSDGTFQYQMQSKLPADATGTYAVGMEGYRMEPIDGVQNPVRVGGFNPVMYVSLDGKDPVARRKVVDQTKCNVCHMNIATHGGIRQNLEYCVMCHNTTATDEARRPAEAMPPTSINLPLLVHRIHRGDDGSQPLMVYGYGNKLNDFSAVTFPGNLVECQTCHLPGTYGVQLPKGINPTIISQAGKVISTTLPNRAVCTSCHDSAETGAHSELQTTASGVETCLVCHGPNKEFDATKFHK